MSKPTSTSAQQLSLRQAMAVLATEPGRFEQRSDELVYLSNVVMTSVNLEDTKLAEVQAANLVLASCNLGASYLLWVDAQDSQDTDPTAFAAFLNEQPGLVKLFRIGWNLLLHLPAQAANKLDRVLSSERTVEHSRSCRL